VITELGLIEVDIPRDRNGEFEPKLVPKGSRRLAGFNERLISMYARG
jgi:transposase-like protein